MAERAEVVDAHGVPARVALDLVDNSIAQLTLATRQTTKRLEACFHGGEVVAQFVDRSGWVAEEKYDGLRNLQ